MLFYTTVESEHALQASNVNRLQPLTILNVQRSIMVMKYIEERIELQDPSDSYSCWIWVGSYRSDVPVGTYKNQTINAKRLVWINYYGEEPHGQIRDTCGNKKCVNPHHMYDTGAGNTPLKALRFRKKQTRTALFNTLGFVMLGAGMQPDKCEEYVKLIQLFQEDGLVGRIDHLGDKNV